MSLSYRQDLDGIRAIAIIGVFLFHLKLDAFSGGFVGVDVFFVLSGFLMIAVLEAASGNRTMILKEFFTRRLLRIFPLALFVLLVITVFVCALFDPVQIDSYFPHFIGAATFVSNVTFWWENSYFSDDLFRPNLHYWSLGVEVQYYLIFPFLWMLFRSRSWVFVLIFAAAVAASFFMTSISPKTAFFMLPFRIGEFMVGVFAYYLLQSPIIRQTEKYADIFILTGLAAIAYAVMFFDRNTLFPGIAALVPVIGTGLLVVYGQATGPCRRLYDNPLFRHLGKISYSLYLWHFPVIFIVTQYFNLKIDWVFGLAIVGLTIGLSELSYAFIEKPYRRYSPENTQRVWKGFAVIVVAFFVIGLAIKTSDGFAFRYDQKTQSVYRSMQDRDSYRCGKLSRVIQPFSKICALHIEPNADKKILLWGDSHADSLKPAFAEVARKAGFSFYLNKHNCSAGNEAGECRANLDIISEALDKGITDVVFHSSTSGFGDELNNGFVNKITKLINANIRVHVVYPIPVFEGVNPQSILTVLEARNDVGPINYSESQYQKQIQPFTHLVDRLTSLSLPVQLYQTYPYFCQSGYCRVLQGYQVYYFDSHHLTRFGARKLAPVIVKIIDD